MNDLEAQRIMRLMNDVNELFANKDISVVLSCVMSITHQCIHEIQLSDPQAAKVLVDEYAVILKSVAAGNVVQLPLKGDEEWLIPTTGARWRCGGIVATLRMWWSKLKRTPGSASTVESVSPAPQHLSNSQP